MVLLLVLLVVVVTLVLVVLAKNNQIQQRNQGIPINHGGGRSLPFFGIIWSALSNRYRIFDWLCENHQTNGSTFVTTIMGRHVIDTIDPKNIKHILQTNFNNYPKGPLQLHLLADFLGHGIFNSDGDNWRLQRKEASTLFHFENLSSSVLNVFVDRSKACIKIFDQVANEKSSCDIQDIFMRYTMDSIAEVGFGYPVNSLEKGSEASQSFVRAFDYVNELTGFRFTIHPIWKMTQNKRTLFHKEVAVMNNFVLDIIQNRRKTMTQQEMENPQDLLGIFLNTKTENGHFSDDYLLDVLKNFLIAGRDTTAVCSTWTCYWISQNPHVEQKLLEELESVFGKYDPSVDLTEVVTPAKLASLKYMKNVIDESLRLSPPVPYDARHCLQEDTLPSGHTISAATGVGYCIYALHRDPTLWKDPLTFNPERWNTDTIQPYQFIPFHAGPRICLGMNMAYLEIKVLLIALLMRFRLELVKGQDIAYKVSITMPTKNGMKMAVRHRTAN